MHIHVLLSSCNLLSVTRINKLLYCINELTANVRLRHKGGHLINRDDYLRLVAELQLFIIAFKTVLMSCLMFYLCVSEIPIDIL